VSGSTKTVEFQKVSQGLERLLKAQHPAVQGVPCRVEGEDVHDPQTRRLLGQKFRFLFDEHPAGEGGRGVQREIWFLASLMPINFLFYGVPGEIIDVVLAQLLRSALGLVRRVRSGDALEKRPYAVDREIDVDGQWIHGRAPTP